MPTEFTPYASLAGGMMIGLAAVLLMASHGRIAGVSGIAVRMLPPFLDAGASGRVVFILGLICGPAFYAYVTGAWAPADITGGTGMLTIAGLLAGFGSVWSSGCTSGHGICGLVRQSLRSFTAVTTFMAVAIATVFIVRHVF